MHVKICCDMMFDDVADCSLLSDACSDSAEKVGMAHGFELRLSYEYQGNDIDRGSGRQSDILFYQKIFTLRSAIITPNRFQ